MIWYPDITLILWHKYKKVLRCCWSWRWKMMHNIQYDQFTANIYQKDWKQKSDSKIICLSCGFKYLLRKIFLLQWKTSWSFPLDKAVNLGTDQRYWILSGGGGKYISVQATIDTAHTIELRCRMQILKKYFAWYTLLFLIKDRKR